MVVSEKFLAPVPVMSSMDTFCAETGVETHSIDAKIVPMESVQKLAGDLISRSPQK
jgi:hypothetical protein